MKNRILINFFAGLVISYTIEVLVICIAVILDGKQVMPVAILLEAFGLAACCSLIGAVFSSEKLSFLVQVSVSYLFAFLVIVIFLLGFKWYDLGEGLLKGKSMFALVIGLFTFFYLIIVLLRLYFQKKKMKLLNEKLTEYKENINRGEG
ncbi:DUF3021 family protein [Anaerocolumna sp. AGMB13025]|jgi:hypothetical protein|uniref:DUF3021 family protein n=1 Tax=Anaerocolumna sp. AGMB13025 TaxID=3039116 RepID=UPI00241FABAA|nr:DUF3021 family protein [Anaerocolumna sp. AGMB13025]WFR55890.1 DUF3021 family protein [Anaerocolumna sp. AGMB13025]